MTAATQPRTVPSLAPVRYARRGLLALMPAGTARPYVFARSVLPVPAKREAVR